MVNPHNGGKGKMGFGQVSAVKWPKKGSKSILSSSKMGVRIRV